MSNIDQFAWAAKLYIPQVSGFLLINMTRSQPSKKSTNIEHVIDKHEKL